MSDFLAKLKALVKLGSATSARGSTGEVPVQNYTYLGKKGDGMSAFPYGFDANVPADTIAILLANEANAENRLAIPMSPFQWKKDLLSGEVVLYHPPTSTEIRFLTDASIRVTAPEVVFTGNVTIQGDLTVVGETALGSVVTSGVKNISDTHTHGGVQSGGSSTAVPD